MKALIGTIVATLGLALLVLAGFGFKGAGSQFGKAYREWRNPRPANLIELTPTVVSSDGTVTQFVPQRNETEIELPAMVVQSSTTACEKEER